MGDVEEEENYYAFFNVRKDVSANKCPPLFCVSSGYLGDDRGDNEGLSSSEHRVSSGQTFGAGIEAGCGEVVRQMSTCLRSVDGSAETSNLRHFGGPRTPTPRMGTRRTKIQSRGHPRRVRATQASGGGARLVRESQPHRTRSYSDIPYSILNTVSMGCLRLRIRCR